jgi:flagellar hook-associated protein 2
MPSITSLGVGTGTDLNAIVTQLVAVERAPLRALQTSATRLQTQVSSVGKIQSYFSALQDASNKLTSNSLWSQSLATSSSDAAVGVVGGATAAAGNYSVSVQALAANQTVASGTTYPNATTALGAGSLTLDIGSWTTALPSAFTAKVGSPPLNITLDATDTLTTLRDKINASGAGVTASLVTDVTGTRLSLRSTTTGAENGFRVTGSGSGAAFSYDPAGGGAGMVLKQAATDAKATVNGIDITSSTNELTTTVEGMTLRLRQVTTAPVDVAVAPDREAVSAAATAFAKAYSDLAAYITEQTKYDAGSRQGGILQGDSAITNLQSRMRGVLNTPSGATSNFPRMSDLGLELQRDGTVKLNTSKFNTALTDLPTLKKAFANRDLADPANDGFARRYADLASKVLSLDGSVTTKTEGLRKLIAKNTQDQEKLNARVDRFQARLTEQYSAMDVRQSRLSALSNYVSQQIAVLNRG